MQTTSILKATPMTAASLSISDSVVHAHDAQARDIVTDGDAFDEDFGRESFRHLGYGLRGILAGLKEGLGRAFSRRHDDGSTNDLREAIAEGCREIAAERRADRRARREARAQLAWEEREIRAARRRGLLAQQVDLGEEFATGPTLEASTRWTSIDERPERGRFVELAHASARAL